VRQALTTLRDDEEFGALKLNNKLISGPEGLFMDYLSCPQKSADGHRSEVEDVVFRKCLASMGSLYASPRTLVLQHKMLPAPGNGMYTPLVPTFPDDPAGQADYDHSGWCMFEQSVARLCQGIGSIKVLQLPLGQTPTYIKYVPPTPEEMNALFCDESRTKFIGAADRDGVIQMYREFLDNTVELEYQTKPCCVQQSENNAFTEQSLELGFCCMMCCLSLVLGTVILVVMISNLERGDAVELETCHPAGCAAGQTTKVPFSLFGFVYFVGSSAIFLGMWLFIRLLLCMCSPTYRMRWETCLSRLLRCEGLGNGPDAPDQRRYVVYGDRGPPSSRKIYPYPS